MKVVEASLLYPDQDIWSDTVITLMRENGYQNWNHQFFLHHYIDCPYQTHSFLLLNCDDNVVGHIAFRETFINASEAKSCWAMHALIDKNYRNLSNFICLVRNAEHHLLSYGYDLILAMPNMSAAEIYKRCLNWKDIGFINFSLSSKVQPSATKDGQLFYFIKTPEWWNWRLKVIKEPRLVHQTYTWNDIKISQLLYISSDYSENSIDLNPLKQDQPICTWDHSNYTTRPSWWSCRFMSRPLSKDLNKKIIDLNNWHVDMIDSDAFSCESVEII
jgi:hypothetical protein